MNGDDRGAAGPLLHHSSWRWHRPQTPDDVAPVIDFMVTGFPGHLAVVGQATTDQPKPLSAAMFDGDQEVGTALGEEEEKGRFECSASACTITTSNSIASSN
jgi:hypothetical protein